MGGSAPRRVGATDRRLRTRSRKSSYSLCLRRIDPGGRVTVRLRVTTWPSRNCSRVRSISTPVLDAVPPAVAVLFTVGVHLAQHEVAAKEVVEDEGGDVAVAPRRVVGSPGDPRRVIGGAGLGRPARPQRHIDLGHRHDHETRLPDTENARCAGGVRLGDRQSSPPTASSTGPPSG